MTNLLKAADAMAEALRLALGQEWEGIRWEGYAREALSAYEAAKREAASIAPKQEYSGVARIKFESAPSLSRTDDVVERLIERIRNKIEAKSDRIYLADIQDTLRALRPGDELPGGLYVVPGRPTAKMWTSLFEAIGDEQEVWRTMLAAAKDG